MHISEGVLSPAVLGAGAALAALGVATGLKRLDYDRLMTVAILSSAFFVASLIHVPIGPASAHLVLNGLLGVMLGWAAFPAIFVALALQALLFQFGGLTVLGVNTFTMALPPVLCFYVFRPMLSGPDRLRGGAAFACGFLSVGVSALLTAGALALSGEEFSAAARALLLAHVPVMFAEGVVTALVVSFIARVRPEMLAFTSTSHG
ncbi:cobalt transporter CbiM [Nitratidesulfovibrio sp. 1201_IL3209]|uniref:cobalt transporter CbiM n=1 Tax=Nitratidesulfovibrio sp. 1201_IL3209 TaxID=3084053 RepID=UPI002FDB3A54